MRQFLIASLIFASFGASAAEVTFGWDYENPPADLQYELFIVPADAEDWGDAPIVTSETTKLVTDLDSETRYKASVRARLDDVVSGFSNIVIFKPGNDPIVIILPDRPSMLRIE